MHILLTVNAGSSSLRLAAYAVGTADDLAAPIGTLHDTTAPADPAAVLRGFVSRLAPACGWTVAHRVVHGGLRLTRPCVIDAAIETESERLAPLAPLHDPAPLAWLRACRAALDDIEQTLARHSDLLGLSGISAADSAVAIHGIAVDEAAVLARAALSFVRLAA